MQPRRFPRLDDLSSPACAVATASWGQLKSDGEVES